MNNKPTREQLKSSAKLWVQYIDGNSCQKEFDAMSEKLKDDWLDIFNYPA